MIPNRKWAVVSIRRFVSILNERQQRTRQEVCLGQSMRLTFDLSLDTAQHVLPESHQLWPRPLVCQS